MGVGGYLSAKAEREYYSCSDCPLAELMPWPRTEDHYRYMLKSTRERMKRSCMGEIEREVSEVLGTVGLDHSACRRVAYTLSKVEVAQQKIGTRQDGLGKSLLHAVARRPWSMRSTAASISDTEKAVSSKISQGGDVGLTAFLLRFG